MIKTAIQTLEENSKADLLSIHENMNGLIERAELISINIDDVESYEDAVNLKRVIKSTHVAIEKRRKELKAPIIDAGKRLDEFAKCIYNPLKEAENLLKQKMLPYEQEQERIKQEEKLAKEKEQQEKDALNEKLMQLNSILPEINSCKNKKEVEQIENKLSQINPKDYGERSDEAGFILTNLKTTCMMIKKSLPDDSQEVLMKDENGIFEEVSFPITETKEEPVVVHDGMKYNPENPEQTLEFDFSEVSEVINDSAKSPVMDAMAKSEKLRNRIAEIDNKIAELQEEKQTLSEELNKVLESVQKSK